MIIILLTYVHKNQNYVTGKVNVIGQNAIQSAQASSSNSKLIRQVILISNWLVPRVNFSP